MDILKFKNVTKIFNDGDNQIQAVRSSSFSIKSGELVAVIGPSGSGKSTLLTMMGGLQLPSSGDIIFMDKNISDMNTYERNKLRFSQIGFVLQSSNLIPFLRIFEQFELVDKILGRKYDIQRAENLMKKLDILKRKNFYPADLSGGERQRAAICRVLYSNPKLLLADEPTASLDTEKAMTVIKILSDITRDEDRATVIVTHDERLLKYCDRIFRITDGKLSFEK